MTAGKLRISAGLSLPAEAVTETFAILAKRGAGKTYTAAVLVEELASAGMQFVVVDPIGVWWGLRSSADGKLPGIPVVVLGGDHGDVPLEVAGGALVADLIVDEGLSVVLDLGRFRKGEQIRFMTDFAERLYHRNRSPLHLVLDEADAFAPQKPRPEGARLLGAIEDLVRRGRARGIGVTLVTQRSAVLNKDVLTQAEVLVALRTTHPRDRDAIEEWAKAHGTTEQLDELRATLAGLPIGEAWFWSPGWLDVFKRVRIRERETFDSSATPKVGEKPKAPKKLADVDLDQLRDRMAATIEKAKAEDPATLRKTIAELRKELAKQPTPVEPKLIETTVEVPAIGEHELAVIRNTVNDLAGQLDQAGLFLGYIREAVAPLVEALDRVQKPAARPPALPAAAARPQPAPLRPRPAQPKKTDATQDGDLSPSRSQQQILNSLALLEGIGVPQATRTQLALLAGVSPKSGGYFNNLGALRTAGLVQYPAGGEVALTDAGRAYADPGDIPSTSADLHERVFPIVGPAKAKILRALIDAYPEPLHKDELAARIDVSPTSGGYFNNLGSLRSLGLIEYPQGGYVVALPVLFLEDA